MADNRADFTVEQDCRIGMDTQNIGGRTGGNFKYKKIEVVLSVLFSLICSVLSSYFDSNISANLVQPIFLCAKSRCCNVAETATTNVTNAMMIVTTNVMTTSVMMTKTISVMTVMMTAATAATASITMTTTSNTKSTAIRLSSKNVHKSCGYSNDAATKSMKLKPTTVAAARY